METIFRQLNDGPCRTYLIGRKESPEVVLIDPLLDRVDNYLQLFEEERLKLLGVIDTHKHADHLSGSALLHDHTGCAYIMHRYTDVVDVTTRLGEGTLIIADVPLQILHTPGHTKDSMSIIVDTYLLTGDVLFLDEGGAGRLDLPGGDAGEHWDSMQRLLGLPEFLKVHPCHNYRNRTSSTLGTQRLKNLYLQHKTKDEHCVFVKNLRPGATDWMIDVLRANTACTRDSNAVSIPKQGNTCENICEAISGIAFGIDPEHVQKINASTLRQLMQEKQPPILLDVREDEEIEGELGYISGITHIPLGTLDLRLSEIDSVKTVPVVTICRSGKRAMIAAQTLLANGFQHVTVLDGGMIAWREFMQQ